MVFFNCWTLKEAFIKALGDGLYHPLDRFDVLLAPGESAKILRVESMPGDHCGWRMESFSPAPVSSRRSSLTVGNVTPILPRS